MQNFPACQELTKKNEIKERCTLQEIHNRYPASHDFCCLLSHLHMYSGSLYCKQYGPRSDFAQSDKGSYWLLPWKYRVWSALEYIYAADVKSWKHFQNKNVLTLSLLLFQAVHTWYINMAVTIPYLDLLVSFHLYNMHLVRDCFVECSCHHRLGWTQCTRTGQSTNNNFL